MNKTIETKQPQTENKMGYMPINKLILSISLPMMLSMLVQSMYNIVDSIYVSQLSENALSAVSLAFPMQSIMTTASAGMGVGVNAILSKSLGRKDYEGASLAANNGIHLSIYSYLLFLFIGQVFAPMFFRAQTDIPEIVEYGTTYLKFVQSMSFGMFGQFIFERLLQSTGKTYLSMITQSTGAILNIILDPIFIFGYFGVPAMGVAGAAIATVIGQTTATILALIFNLKFNKEIKLNLFKYRPDLGTIKKIYAIAIPSIIMTSIGSVTSVFVNRILLSYTSTATAVFGIYHKLQSFIFMPLFGLNNGIVPIISYNYGAGKRERMIRAIKISCIYMVSIMGVGIAIMQLLPDKLLMLFDASENMFAIGIPALRIISIGFIFSGFNIIISSVFQALGNAIYSMIVSAARQVCVLLPVAYLMSLTGNLDLVWFSFPIAEFVSVGLSSLFLVRIYRTVIRNIGK